MMQRQPRWGAVYAMALCSFVLVAAEFLPVSLLSPIARALQLSEGQAGQAITVSAVFALCTSLSISSLLGTVDRRSAMLALIVLLIVSGAIVAFAPSYLILLVGRALLGIAIGGFWSMSTAIAMRLVPTGAVPKALAVINGGNALATTLAAPLGSLMGGLIGWRGASFCVVPIALAAVLWLALTLPRLPMERHRAGTGMLALLRQPPLLLGLVTVALFFAGQFSLFTYLRPFLEQVTHVGVSMLSMMLLVVGAAGFIGTMLIGRVLDNHLYLMLAVLPAIMAVVAIILTFFGSSVAITTALLAVWGFTGTAAPVAWWTWLARTAPNDAEAGGGLMVAVIALAITLGASVGGIVVDAVGIASEFLISAAILTSASLAAFAVARSHGRPAATLKKRR